MTDRLFERWVKCPHCGQLVAPSQIALCPKRPQRLKDAKTEAEKRAAWGDR